MKQRLKKRSPSKSTDDLEELTQLDKGEHNLSAVWFKECKTTDEKEDLYKRLRNFKDVFKLVDGILTALYRVQLSKQSDFTCPQWAYLTAYREGYKRAIADLYKIIPHEDQFNDDRKSRPTE